MIPLPPSSTNPEIPWAWILLLMGTCVAVVAWWAWSASRMHKSTNAPLLPSFERQLKIIREYANGNNIISRQSALFALHRLQIQTRAKSLSKSLKFRGRQLSLSPALLQLAAGVYLGYDSSKLHTMLDMSRSHLYRLRKDLRFALQLNEKESLDSAVVELFGLKSNHNLDCRLRDKGKASMKAAIATHKHVKQ